MANTHQCVTRVQGKTEFMASGHLLVDEMKLKSDIYWNVESDEVVGFASDTKTLDLAAELKAMLKDARNEKKTQSRPTKKPAVYVNQ